jgi:hypothetical protein
MALLAEQLADEWLNRAGFFTLRGVKSGVGEIDLLGVRMTEGHIEGWHVEVQVSVRPVSYIGKLSPEEQIALGARAATSAGIERWVEAKFRAARRRQMRERCWRDVDWQFKMVHGRVHEPAELQLPRRLGLSRDRPQKLIRAKPLKEKS